MSSCLAMRDSTDINTRLVFECVFDFDLGVGVAVIVAIVADVMGGTMLVLSIVAASSAHIAFVGV